MAKTKTYKPKKDKLTKRRYYVEVETMIRRPEQLERLDKIVRREIFFSTGSEATVWLVDSAGGRTLLEYNEHDHL